MTASQKDILEWLEEAKSNKSAFLIIGHDPFDHDNFPIYCATGEECRTRLNSLISSGNSYDEVYNMSLPLKPQIAQRRAMNLPQ